MGGFLFDFRVLTSNQSLGSAHAHFSTNEGVRRPLTFRPVSRPAYRLFLGYTIAPSELWIKSETKLICNYCFLILDVLCERLHLNLEFVSANLWMPWNKLMLNGDIIPIILLFGRKISVIILYYIFSVQCLLYLMLDLYCIWGPATPPSGQMAMWQDDACTIHPFFLWLHKCSRHISAEEQGFFFTHKLTLIF